MNNVSFSLVMLMAWRFILYSFWCIAVLFSPPSIVNGASPGLVNPQISDGWYHTVALKSDGTVWAWGCNDHGQLGDGTNTNRNIPVSVKKLRGFTSILCGMRHTVTLKADGTVWAWGRNDFGQLGDGTNKDRSTPVRVKTLSDVTAILCGMWHTIALKADGTVWAWGRNDFGQLGDGTDTNRNTPVQVKDINLGLTITKTSSFGGCELRSIVIYESVLNLERGVNYNIKVTLSGSGCLVQNKEITAKINWMGKNCISVLPSSVLSDENGEAMFTIKTKNKSGRATVTFKADSLYKDLIVVVKK